MRLLILIGCFFIAHSMCAQNLVPNPSFEDNDSCPQHNGDFFCLSWFNPTRSSPDYFNECWNGWWYDSQDVPVNMIGSEPAHTGVAYAGFASISSSINVREYISIKLSDTLHTGSTYCLEFYTTLGDSSFGGTNMLAAHFSSIPDTMYAGYYLNNLPFNPQIEWDTVITDTTNWVKMSGQFVADGGECYLTIGVFRPDSALRYEVVRGDSSIVNTYYFIDDVSVWNCDTAVVTYNDFTLYPNPSNGQFSITGNFPAGCELIIYNMLGQIWCNPISLPEGNNNVPVFLNLAQGVYFYRIRAQDGTLNEGKIIIQY